MQNGGHCQPGIFNKKPHIARFELATFNFLKDLVDGHNIPCDFRVVGGVQALPTTRLVDLARKRLEELRLHHPDLADKATLFTEPADLKAVRVLNAPGAVFQPCAAKCWPYKLVIWVLETLLRDHPPQTFNLQTTTPTLHLQRVPDGWVVHTSRGQVAAKEVVLATNGYTSFLLPRMMGLIVPVRGQVSALEPPSEYKPLEHTEGWRPGGSDNYLIQRDGDGTIVVGGERLSVAGAEEGIWHDDTINKAISDNLSHCTQLALKLRPADNPEEEKLRVLGEWTGIMGYSIDDAPWVGKVPASLSDDDEGGRLWICAGFTGHGMPVAARCAVAVSQMIMGHQNSLSLPPEFVPSYDRVRRAKSGDFRAKTLEEQMMNCWGPSS
jgi:glycine/D-amino acid oxidase-like deaminating enzyme